MKFNKSRRQFLIKTGLATGIVSATVAGILLPSYCSKQRENDWAFLHNPKVIHYTDLDMLVRDCVPLTSETQPGDKTLERQRFYSDISQQILEHGKTLGWKELEATLSRQTYALPESDSIREQHFSYVTKAKEFLYEQIKGLVPINLELVPVKPRDDFSASSQKATYLVSQFYDLWRATVKNKETGEKFVKHLAYNGNGALSRFIEQNGNFIPELVVLTQGTDALNSPFSEFLPICTAAADQRYERSVGEEQMTQATEAFSESIAHLLAKQLAKELNIPKGEKIVDEALKTYTTDDRYKYVPTAINWVRKNGIQNAFDLYMDDPGKFMESIKK